ncbi:FAD-dependent oxidoreductase [Gayadomonas joobiniege]|uniref:FAD-dependent oxidoreductase n=1 Tax=Gayadomonas joobiniege TaxID=1234606 RepID=UPI000367E9A0|nr:FAD-dependent oxidoreductase [Gayadomonas joobiniege]
MKIEQNSQHQASDVPVVAVIGGGLAGSVIALKLVEAGYQVNLIEKGNGLVNGPPICHLHAGGSFYRELSDENCLTLLEQSIDILKVFPQCVNLRPTVIAVPTKDESEPLDLLPRFKKLSAAYQDLIKKDHRNKVLGDAGEYFIEFDRAQLDALAQQKIPASIRQLSDWLIPVAKTLDLDKLKYPLILVQEYGLSGFRFSALAELTLNAASNCNLYLNHQVTDIQEQKNGWQINMCDSEQHKSKQLNCDFVVNACGYQSGQLDDMLAVSRERMLEFKAAYVAHWPAKKGQWPEVLFHGKRGTPHGMAQLTPYPDNYFQLHGMTQEITLFSNGLARSTADSAQPKLAAPFQNKLDKGWPLEVVQARTLSNIKHISQYIPAFESAKVAAKPLYGAQQIPGDNPDLRTADVSFYKSTYARAEIVKASSVLAASRCIINALKKHCQTKFIPHEGDFYKPTQCSAQALSEKAQEIAKSRGYPPALAREI